jgi:predicted short-subunit dehydrogenase-like oxidoreductase (DUF2520 family)
MRHYFGLLGLPCSGWSRRDNSPFNTHPSVPATDRLKRTIAPASHVLLLVSDGAIGHFVADHPILQGKTLVHCSGALSIPGVAGAHPLMTFGEELYHLDRYRKIPFAVESPWGFEEILPGLPNPHWSVEPDQKALYHALCVMAGNFPQILWRAVADRLEQDLAIDTGAMEPYLRQVLENFLSAPARALTGPLARGDHSTVERNLAALDGDPLHSLYQSFSEFHTRDAGAFRRASGE